MNSGELSMIIRRVIPALVATIVAGSAFAAALSATGVVSSVDPAMKDVVLQDGETFTLPAKFDAAKLKVGEKVKITYVKKGSEMVASKIEAAK
jgi:Cu/Ag efflux protein CusF